MGFRRERTATRSQRVERRRVRQPIEPAQRVARQYGDDVPMADDNDDFGALGFGSDSDNGGYEIDNVELDAPSIFTDMDELLERMDLHDDQVTALPLNVNLEDIQQADQYNEQPADEDTIPTQSFDDAPESIEPPHPARIGPSLEDFEDLSEPIVHERSKDPTPSRFMTALGLWCEESGISRTQYASLLEILRMPEARQDIQRLPASVSTLKRHSAAQIPLMALRKKSIPLQPGKQSREKSEEDLIFFDPVNLFSNFISSNIANTIHLGLGEFHDAHLQDELFKSHSWRSSIRTTSGQFAHYSQSGKPIFPSDFVAFRCEEQSCYRSCSTRSTFDHVGRVIGVGRDYRSSALLKGTLVIQLQEVLSDQDVQKSLVPDPPLKENERVLSWNNVFFCPEKSIGVRLDVVLDYTWENDKLESRVPPYVPMDSFLIRRILDTGVQPPVLTPLCLNPPLRGELEIQTFGREHLEQLDKKVSGRQTYSIPLMTFIDGFGLYRNTYRTLMGMYFIIAGLPFRERARRANVLPFTLGPHGSNFADVVEAIRSLALLDRGVEVEIGGIGKVLLLAFTLAYIGDMPQQQKNSGMKTQRAYLGCRMCHIDSEQRGTLDYDTFLQGRYHFTLIGMRDDLNAKSTRQQREAYGTTWGIDPDPSSMTLHNLISPALDIILSRPGDPAHSEYQGLSNMLHNLLLEAILTPAAAKSYATVLRTFPFPPTWPRVQGPLHHLRSYSLSEHARWSVVIPLLLRCWLRERHIRKHLIDIFKANNIVSPVDYLVSQFSAAARSNLVLMSASVSAQDRSDMLRIVYGYRSQLQQLLSALAQSMASDRRRFRSASVASSVASSVELEVEDQGQDQAQAQSQGGAREQAKKAEVYESHMKKPNMHVAIHYPALADEYGLPVNTNVLVGEDKHRAFKKMIYTTNHRRPERDLLSKENLRQTLRLVLADAFKHTDPVATHLVKDIYAQCPELFSSLLPRSEQAHAIENDNDDDDEQGVMADEHHQNPAVIGCIQPRYIHDTLGLPTRSNQLAANPQFTKALADAYGRDYGLPNIIIFANSSLHWCKKFSFYNPKSQRRCTFKMGDFIRTRAKPTLPSSSTTVSDLIRIDQIFVHKWNLSRRLFVRGTNISRNVYLDAVLGSGYHHLRTTTAMPQIIVGLSSVDPTPQYVVPINSERGVELVRTATAATEFLWAQHTVEWL